MPRYKCLNEDCILYTIIITRNTKFKIVDDEMVDTGKECPECKCKCKTYPEKGYPTAVGNNIYSGK